MLRLTQKGRKLDLLLAIWKANCTRCQNEDWLYAPESDKYGLLCETCMNKLNLSIDIKQTKRELGKLFPKEYLTKAEDKV